MRGELERESLGKRFQRFCVFVGGIFALSLGFMVGHRLSTDALAMLIGLGAGVVVMVPALAVMVWAWRRQDERQRERERSASRAVQTPSVVVVAPPSLPPGYGGQPHALGYQRTSWDTVPQERKFTVVGEE